MPALSKKGLLPVLTALACAGTLTAVAPAAGAQQLDTYELGTHRSHARAASSGWSKVSTGTVSSLAKVSLARSDNGALHVLYKQEVGAASMYEVAALNAANAVVERADVVGTWASLTSHPVITLQAGNQLRIAFAGLRTTSPEDYFGRGMAFDALHVPGSYDWTLQEHALTKTGMAYGSYGFGATTLSDGTPVTATALNSDIHWRVGDLKKMDAAEHLAAPDDQVTTMTGSLGDTTLVNSDDAVWMGFWRWGPTAAESGVYLQQIHPLVGQPIRAPRTYDSVLEANDDRIAMVARPDGKIVLAYKTAGNKPSIALWQVGSSSAKVVPGTRDASNVALSSDSKGRLWLAWKGNDGKVRAARSGPRGLRMGAVVTAGRPTSGSIRSVAVSGSTADASVVVNDTSATSIYAARVRPGLSLAASPRKWKAGTRTTVRVKVTDAGLPVQNARVAGNGERCKTNAKGVCSLTFTLGKPRKVTLTASAPGFEDAKVKLTVKRR